MVEANPRSLGPMCTRRPVRLRHGLPRMVAILHVVGAAGIGDIDE